MKWLIELPDSPNFKNIVVLLVVAGTVLFSAVFFGRVAWLAYDEQFWKEIGLKHFPATVGLPAAALAAFILVLVLETTHGDIEFRVLGFEFKGASGPAVLWVLTFLAMTFSIWLLWDSTYEKTNTETNNVNQTELSIPFARPSLTPR